ncbi:MAG TPA: acyl-CoA dehydrogenase family protein [Actinocrinis sp.]|nr:acyl-CoA dehydrogenase family protein [Actinocrinis sp.]
MDAADFAEIRATVRRFVREEVVPLEDEIEQTDAVPEPLRAKAAAMGLFGYTLPEEYGGLGATAAEDVRLAIEFGWTSPAFRSMFGTNNGIAGQVFVHSGTAEQKQLWLPRLAAGRVAAFALTEAEAGSDPSGMTATATRDDQGGHVLSGTKRFITNALLADVFIVFARTGTPADGTKGISAFVVEAGTPGLSVGPKDHKTGQAGAWTSEVHLDQVQVGPEALVGGVEGVGFAAAMRSLAKGRLHIAAFCVGLAERALHEAVLHARSNKQGGRSIGEFQLVQALLAETKAELDAGRAMVLDAADKYDSGEDRKVAPSCAKLFCSEMAYRAADRAVQVHGGMGYMRGVPVERILRDARLFRIYEGTSEIQKLIIGRALLAAD